MTGGKLIRSPNPAPFGIFSTVVSAVTDTRSLYFRTGMIGSRQGIFPSNYVKMKE